MIRMHKEGKGHWLILVVLCIIAVLCFFFYPPAYYFIVPFIVIFGVFSLIFFRHPERPIELRDQNLLYSPADGKVVIIKDVVEDVYLNGPAKQISIFMSPLDVHLNRVPVDGTVELSKYEPGKYLVAWHPKSSELNERTTIGIKTYSGHKIMLRQIAGIMARRIVLYLKEGQKINQGEELGFIKLGSRCDIFVPQSSEILVELGQQVKGNIDEVVRLS